ncbi:nuclear pore complex protein Nup93-like [Tropilaelaps mercedesae]|uniref:Nuclear pore complex protein Nup93-like n=1 Tax=Tropilaelaps mercedesae TaxID=418985 RepID=A0A1V9XF58_9ACAR|nr:nuclear pore complex protein Nup93-like [Tropilaelaps mercedesae]
MEGGTKAGLAELVQDTDKLVADLDGGQDLPRVVRTTRQMITDGDQLRSRVSEDACSREQADVQAAILLGSQDFDLLELSHRIEKLLTAQSFGPLESIQPTDIDGFLRNERQSALTSAIIEHLKNTHDEVDTFILRAQQERWEEQRRKVLSSIEFSADTTND